jgi:hypothetical protein
MEFLNLLLKMKGRVFKGNQLSEKTYFLQILT